MEQNVFVFSFIIEGSTEKVLQFKITFKSIYNKNLCIIEQKSILEQFTEVQWILNLLIDIIFVMKFFSDDLFRAAPYCLMLVLNKDAMFHYL